MGTTCEVNHFDIEDGAQCPRCGKVIQRDRLGGELNAPELKPPALEHPPLRSLSEVDEAVAPQTEDRATLYLDHLKSCVKCRHGLCDEGRGLWEASGRQPADIRNEDIGKSPATEDRATARQIDANNATPRPWKRSCFLIQGPKGDWVTHTGLGNLPPSRSHESEANAELIVKAVNSYVASQKRIEALEAALKDLAQSTLNNLCFRGGYRRLDWVEDDYALADKVRAIITDPSTAALKEDP